jgi:hypothetical protein
MSWTSKLRSTKAQCNGDGTGDLRANWAAAKAQTVPDTRALRLTALLHLNKNGMAQRNPRAAKAGHAAAPQSPGGLAPRP